MTHGNGVEVDVAMLCPRCARRRPRPPPPPCARASARARRRPIAHTCGRLVRHSPSTATKPRSSTRQPDRVRHSARRCWARGRSTRSAGRRSPLARRRRRPSIRPRRRDGPGFTEVIATPSWIASPCLAKSFCASFATASSAAPRNAGSASSTVTSAPRRRHTLPISSPMTPAPTTPSLRGTSGIASAPALSRMRSLSNATPGSARGLLPVATTTCFAASSAASAPSTLTSQPSFALPPANDPRPCRKRILCFLKGTGCRRCSARRPCPCASASGRRRSTVLRRRCRGRRTRARVLVVLGGLQQRLARNAADVRAGAARRRLAAVARPVVDAGDREAELRRADGRDVTAGAGPDDGDVEGCRASRPLNRSSSRRAGSSSASLIATSDSTASRPSMIRWSYDCAR